MATIINGRKLKCHKCGSTRIIRNGSGGSYGKPKPQYFCQKCRTGQRHPRGLN